MTDESSTNKKSDKDTSEDDEAKVDAKSADAKDDDAAAAAKKRSLIIRGVVIAGLAYYGVTEFILKEERPPPPPVAAKTKPKDIEKKPDEQKPATEIAKQEELQPPVENINVAQKQEEVVIPAASLTEVVIPVAEKEMDKKIDQLIENEVIHEPVKTARSGERQERKEEVNLADKIVIEDKYVEPPTFEYLGRGLVYNCKEKFWACLNKLSYIQCNKNMKWNSTNNKPIECAVVNVYNSNDDCETVQRYNVSTGQPTPFCKP